MSSWLEAKINVVPVFFANLRMLYEITEAASVIYEQAHQDANIILGSVIDESLADEVIVTIIATGCQRDQAEKQDDQVKATIRDDSEDVETGEDFREQPEQKKEASGQELPTSGQKAIDYVDLEMSKEIDLNDLDVPAFLRKEARQDDVNN